MTHSEMFQAVTKAHANIAVAERHLLLCDGTVVTGELAEARLVLRGVMDTLFNDVAGEAIQRGYDRWLASHRCTFVEQTNAGRQTEKTRFGGQTEPIPETTAAEAAEEGEKR